MADQISPELVERMVALVRRMDRDKVCGGYMASTGHFLDAQAIAALLPAPVDPDLIEARKLVADRYDSRLNPNSITATMAGDDDETSAVRNCLLAIKRGRELERQS